jgi:hypothetical protein
MKTVTRAREIAALVPMPRLLAELGFQANERTRRCPCSLHGGSNPSAFSWTDSGLWHCHSCGRGGVKIKLVRIVRTCSFREASEFLATLAGVEYKPGFLSRESIEYQKRMHERESADTDALLGLEFAAWCEARDVVLQLEGIRRNASKRLQAIHRGELERWPGETDLAWETLAEVSRQMPRAAAAYNVISFAPSKDRFAFAIDAAVRQELTNQALEREWIADAKGYRFEVLL